MVESSKGNLVFLALENIKLVSYEDTALAQGDRVVLQGTVIVVLIEVSGKNYAVVVQCSYSAL